MNKYHKSLLGSVAALALIAFLVPIGDARALTPSAAPEVGETGVYSEVINPRIPSKLKFADQTIDLDRTDRWERLDRELTSMVYTHGNTLLAIKRANRYFPMLAPLLQKNGVPSDLIYLAVIESTLNPRALSPAKAGGLWQFMPTTAKEYGLEVNDYVDERYDPVKATEAACRYLKKSYAKYGNWESVAASYNGGVARITNELAAQQVDTAYDLYLADETMRYMFRLLAMKLIMENPKDYGFRLSSDQLYQPLEYTTVEVSTPVEDWPTWAKEHGIDYMTLRENNPWIRAKSLPNKTGKTYLVNVPTKDSMSRARQKKSVYNPAWVTD
ncbi:MAG: lytic transglycosylase domain-containing protein [Bacteroides sp.]|nr:lytic transglycosylase domain-containing protein [Bacteroides sp.]MDE6812621.1 lytic transglycosylase domain-containing protein [Duncaniella sp.]